MISDALAGKIDLIVTKSVSRFARNTVDSLTTVRKLKDKGIEVYFEKENIYTMDGKGELLITIMSSLAQEESRSISENVTWGKRKSAADGKVELPYAHFLGYRKGTDGLPEIVEEEARIVRMIYRMFLAGKTATAICKQLMKMEIPAPSGRGKWYHSTVMSILQNEKYKGSALLQKKVTVDFLTKKRKNNEGEAPQYYIEHSHAAIIDPEEFDMVQNEIARRKKLKSGYSANGVFASKVICGDCGGFYGAKVWHSNSKYRRVVWQCNNKFKNDTKCRTPHITEDELKARFLEEFNKLIEMKEAVIAGCKEAIDAICDLSDLDEEIQKAALEVEMLARQSRQMVEENAAKVQEQEAYARQFDDLAERYESAQERLEAAQTERQKRIEKRRTLERFVDEISQQDGVLKEFDEELFRAVTENIVVESGEVIRVNFKTISENSLNRWCDLRI